MQQREEWSSRVGFVLAAAGSAVGLGNIWRFPYVVGTNGGAAYVAIYLLTVFLVGYPLLMTEIAIGQKTSKNPIGAFKELAPKTPWWLTGALGIIAGYVILSFYGVVAGWSVAYFFKSIAGSLGEGVNYAQVFKDHITSPIAPLFTHALFMLLTLVIIALGVVKGIDRCSRIMMPMLFIILIALVFRSLTLDGASKGLAFYLVPNFAALTWKSVLSAIGQAFFTLSLGMGCMITYGSYLSKKDEVAGNAAWILGLDTFVALLGGFAVFPAVFALNQDPAAGAGLAFITLPAVFAHMPGGVIFGPLFFLLLTVAALTSSISLLEIVVAWLVDEYGWARKKASIVMGVVIFLIGVPASLSLGAVKIEIFGRSFFDSLDFLQEAILLPFGGLLTAIFAGYVWKAKKIREQINLNSGKIRIGAWFDWVIRYLIPVAILFVMVFGLIPNA